LLLMAGKKKSVPETPVKTHPPAIAATADGN